MNIGEKRTFESKGYKKHEFECIDGADRKKNYKLHDGRVFKTIKEMELALNCEDSKDFARELEEQVKKQKELAKYNEEMYAQRLVEAKIMKRAAEIKEDENKDIVPIKYAEGYNMSWNLNLFTNPVWDFHCGKCSKHWRNQYGGEKIVVCPHCGQKNEMTNLQIGTSQKPADI